MGCFKHFGLQIESLQNEPNNQAWKSVEQGG